METHMITLTITVSLVMARKILDFIESGGKPAKSLSEEIDHFRIKLAGLGLTIRTYSAIDRPLSLYRNYKIGASSDDEMSLGYVKREGESASRIFEVGGRFMQFDEWVAYQLSTNGKDLGFIRDFGKKAKTELMESLHSIQPTVSEM